MQNIPSKLTDSWPLAFQKPPFRVVPFAMERRENLKEITFDFANLQRTSVRHLKRLLWHPDQFETHYSTYVATGTGDFVRIKCVDDYAALISWTQIEAEIYNKVSGKSLVYDNHADFFADGWVLD